MARPWGAATTQGPSASISSQRPSVPRLPSTRTALSGPRNSAATEVPVRHATASAMARASGPSASTMLANASSPSAMSWAGRARRRLNSASSASIISTNASRTARQGQGMREASSAVREIWRS